MSQKKSEKHLTLPKKALSNFYFIWNDVDIFLGELIRKERIENSSEKNSKKSLMKNESKEINETEADK